MMKRYVPIYRILTPFLTFWMAGCHQSPPVPVSAIPSTCQIYRLTTINEGIRDTTTYFYNDFGHILESSYRKWVNGKIVIQAKKNFAYSYDHFLITQIEQNTIFSGNGSQTQDDKGYVYTYLDGKINKVVVRNNITGVTLLVQEYQHENGVVKTVTESDGKQLLSKRYTFGTDGKLTKYEEPGYLTSAEVSNGKITKKTLTNGSIINYQFDTQGQLINETSTSTTEQTTHLYTYDTAPYWDKTQLRLRGFPVIELGGSSLSHNVVTDDLEIRRNGLVIQKQKLVYNHTYNKSGYSLGYGRSDGAQQRTIYSSCL